MQIWEKIGVVHDLSGFYRDEYRSRYVYEDEYRREREEQREYMCDFRYDGSLPAGRNVGVTAGVCASSGANFGVTSSVGGNSSTFTGIDKGVNVIEPWERARV